MAEWTEQTERSNPFTLRLICYIALNLSRGFTRLLLWPITLYFFIGSPSARYASGQYLRRVPGCKGNAWQIIRHIHHFSAVVLDRVYFLTDQFQRFSIDIYDEENVLTTDIWRDKYRYGEETHPFDSMRRVVEGVYAKDLFFCFRLFCFFRFPYLSSLCF